MESLSLPLQNRITVYCLNDTLHLAFLKILNLQVLNILTKIQALRHDLLTICEAKGPSKQNDAGFSKLV